MSHNNQTEQPQNFETSPHRQVEIRMGNTLSPIGVIHDDPAIIAESQTQQTSIQQTNDPIPPSDGPPEELEEREVETQHITAKCQCFSYSKKLLRAPHSFWLNPSSYKSFEQQFPTCKEQPIYLYGKIIKCPNLRNNKQFIISWNLRHSNFSDESVLRSFSSSLDTKNKLQQYIQDFLDSKQPPQPPIPVINKDNSNNVDPANSCPVDQNDSAAHPLTHAPTYNKNEGSASKSNSSDDSPSQNSKQHKHCRISRQTSAAVGRRRSPRLRKRTASQAVPQPSSSLCRRQRAASLRTSAPIHLPLAVDSPNTNRIRQQLFLDTSSSRRHTRRSTENDKTHNNLSSESDEERLGDQLLEMVEYVERDDDPVEGDNSICSNSDDSNDNCTYRCKGMYSHLAKCAKCGVLCHSAVVKDQMGRNGWKIHGRPEFKGLTCFEILHSTTGREIFGKQKGRQAGKDSDIRPFAVTILY